MYHPDTLQILQKAGLKDERNFPVIENLREFKEKCENAGVEPKPEAISLYRLKHQGKEFVYYHRQWRGKDFMQNDIEAYEPEVGKLEKPVIQYQVDPATGKRVAAGVARWDLEYTIPFSKANVDKILKEGSIDSPNFYIKDGSFRFAVSYEEFVSSKFDDVAAKGKADIIKRKSEAENA